MPNTISIKGTRQGLTICWLAGDLAGMLQELEQHLANQGAFFRGGQVALQAGDHPLSAEDLQRISQLLTANELLLRTVVTTNSATEAAARALGLRLLSGESPVEAERPLGGANLARPSETSRGILVRHVVRSGQVVRHTGHVVVIGDVNTGAEIIAGGDIVIWGRLNGVVHAGSMGDNGAVVCALDFSPTLLRIGEVIARPGEEERPRKPYPEIASVRDNLIVVEPWDRALRGV